MSLDAALRRDIQKTIEDGLGADIPTHMIVDEIMTAIKMAGWIGEYAKDEAAFDRALAQQQQTFKSLSEGKCGCHRCIRERGEIAMHMVVCRECGNKRCPHATDHDLSCTRSNEPGQAGSIYA